MRKMTDTDLNNIIGTSVKGYNVEDARIKRGIYTDSDHYGILLCKNDYGHYVTWQFHLDEDEQVNPYWGHYFMLDGSAAQRDFDNRDMDAEPDNADDIRSFDIEITETLQRVISVEALNSEEAEQIAESLWKNGVHVLGADDFHKVEFEATDNNHEPGICPACKNEDLDYDGFVIEDGLCVYKWKCNGCGVSGKEYYTLNFSEHIIDEDYP